MAFNADWWRQVATEVSVLVVTYECKAWARDCLDSLHESAQDVAFEIVVVDNASSDGTADMIRSEFPAVTLLALSDNLGFARGMNRAADVACGEYLLLLNPDTVVRQDTVGNLLRFARENPGNGLYGGRTLRSDGSVDISSCWGQASAWSLFCFATMMTTAFKRSRFLDPESLGKWQRDTVREVGIVTGCLLLISKALWDALDGFDERFFMYGEDADLAIRAREQGMRPVITPEAVVTHEVGASSAARPDKMILVLQSKATLIRKHWPQGKRQFGLLMLLLGTGARALLGTVVQANSAGSGAWRTVWRARRQWLGGFPAATGRDPSLGG
jgi:N-acetylglucosaminyl-diphospho-decaprenol L-rhamnosyltransferase